MILADCITVCETSYAGADTEENDRLVFPHESLMIDIGWSQWQK